MGAGAFIMAEFLGVKYTDIAIAAAIPALLYFSALLFYVRFEALRVNLPPVPRDQIPTARSFLSWKQLAPFLIPVAVLIYFIMNGWSAGRSCFYASMASLILYFFSDFNRANMKQRMAGIINGFEKGGRAIVEVVSLLK